MSSTRSPAQGHWFFEFLNRRHLTAVMVALALLVSLLVLPSLLLVVTPSRKREERERLLELHPSPMATYNAHSRDTAQQRDHAPADN